MKTITLITCDTPVKANLIQGRLLNEGIECFLTNQHFTNLMPHLNNMMGSGVQVIVDENDLERARKIIADELTPDNQNIKCPYCGSEHVTLGLGNHKKGKFIQILLSIFFFIPLGNLKPKYYCQDCKQEIR